MNIYPKKVMKAGAKAREKVQKNASEGTKLKANLIEAGSNVRNIKKVIPSAAKEYHRTKGSIINKALGGRFA